MKYSKTYNISAKSFNKAVDGLKENIESELWKLKDPKKYGYPEVYELHAKLISAEVNYRRAENDKPYIVWTVEVTAGYEYR
jgi:hypothetical protein